MKLGTFVVVSGLLMGCSDPTGPDLSGSYILASVDGTLPARVGTTYDAQPIMVLRGTLEIRGRRYSEQLTTSAWGQEGTLPDQGFVSIAGRTLTLDGNRLLSGTYGRDTVSYTDRGKVYVYVR